MQNVKYELVVPVVLVCNDEYWLPYALRASEGWFNRYVIYDVGSTDRTPEIIEKFTQRMKGKAEFFVRQMPMCPPRVQGAFRNSMIAEARSEYYFVLDADEIYTDEGFEAIIKQTQAMYKTQKEYNPLYGVIPRIEITGDLKGAYGQGKRVSHHRIYHRTAIFTGSHPGEAPLYKMDANSERWYNDVTCYHFHNTERSPKDAEVPKRLERRSRGTYSPGQKTSFNLFEKLPLLKERIEDFPVNPLLSKMQHDQEV